MPDKNIFHRWLNSRQLPFVLILAGLFLRALHYLGNRSLWMDEAWLARDVHIRTFSEILRNIIVDQSLPAIPPPGFMIIEKLAIVAWGNHEFALRLFPFLSGMLAVALYWFLLKKWTDRPVAVMALSFFVCAESLIYYSAECKQYSSDVLAALCLYWAADHFFSKTASLWRAVFFGLIGWAAMFVSHTAVFILGGIGIAQTISFLNAHQRKTKFVYLCSYFFWAIGFFVLYLVYLRAMTGTDNAMGEFVHNSAKPHFMPAELWTAETMQWLGWSFTNFTKDPLGLAPALLAAGMFLLGAVSVFKSDRIKFGMLFLPMVLMVAASGLQKYPFLGRFLMFLVPMAFLFIAQGIAVLGRNGRTVLALAVFLILLAPPLKDAVMHVVVPRVHEEMRPVVSFLKDHQQAGDKLFMNSSAQYGYRYYLMYYRFDYGLAEGGYFLDARVQSALQPDHIPLVLNTMTPAGKIYSMTRLYRKPPSADGTASSGDAYPSPQRTWLLLSSIDPATEQFIKGCFDDRGKQISAFNEPGVSLYLYELREPPTTIRDALEQYRLKAAY